MDKSAKLYTNVRDSCRAPSRIWISKYQMLQLHGNRYFLFLNAHLAHCFPLIVSNLGKNKFGRSENKITKLREWMVKVEVAGKHLKVFLDKKVKIKAECVEESIQWF